jgi:hypothetical protein
VASGLFRVNLMAERGDLPSDLWLPIGDYQPPSPAQVPTMIALFEDILSRPNDTYAGCFGGVGRTGTILASFLAYLGSEDPVLQTRWGLGYRAVETAEQQDFVAHFPKRPISLHHSASCLDRPPTAFHPRRASVVTSMELKLPEESSPGAAGADSNPSDPVSSPASPDSNESRGFRPR